MLTCLIGQRLEHPHLGRRSPHQRQPRPRRVLPPQRRQPLLGRPPVRRRGLPQRPQRGCLLSRGCRLGQLRGPWQRRPFHLLLPGQARRMPYVGVPAGTHVDGQSSRCGALAGRARVAFLTLFSLLVSLRNFLVPWGFVSSLAHQYVSHHGYRYPARLCLHPLSRPPLEHCCITFAFHRSLHSAAHP